MSITTFVQSLITPFTKHDQLRATPSSGVGMRSGHVRLNEGEQVHWHTTGNSEESIVVLRGHGEVLIKDEPPQSFDGPCFIWIPPNTEHSVRNRGICKLEYVYGAATVAK